MKTFYVNFNQVDSIIILKVFILPNNRKKYLEIQQP